MSDINVKSSSSKIINIITVIDSDSLYEDYKDRNPSKALETPTGIEHKYSYMVSSGYDTIAGHGTADLNIKDNVGDVIRWTGISESANFDREILIYKLVKFGSGVSVFDEPTFRLYTKYFLTPTPQTIFPVSYPENKFWFMQSDIIGVGTMNYKIRFAMYHRPQGGMQELFGCFEWDPIITVKT